MPFSYDMSLFIVIWKIKLILSNVIISSTIHCSIRGHTCIINTMLTWSTTEFGTTVHVFKVPLCNLINFALFQYVGGIFI